MMPHSSSFASLNSVKSSTDSNDDQDDDNYISLYPYSRSEECSWQPEEVSKHLSDLLSVATETIPKSEKTASLLSALHGLKRDSVNNNSNVLNCGWSTHQARYLRLLFGMNTVYNDEDDDDDNDITIFKVVKIPHYKFIHKLCPWFYPVLGAFLGQFDEPLNIMLLVSACISLALGQTADAVSIAVALIIVSLVAAVQEFRSEAALEKLADLVPHTCTVMRDGRVRDHYAAKNLVIGDLIILSSGE